MKELLVELEEWFEGGRLIKRRVNGVDMPIEFVPPMENIAYYIQHKTISLDEAKEQYHYHPSFKKLMKLINNK